MKNGTVMRAANIFMSLVFLLGALVQYNDPDPLIWMLIYGGAFVVCVLAVMRRPHSTPALVVGLAALVWGLLLVPRVLGQVEIGSLFREAGMATLEIEEAREALGLFIIAAWMHVVFWTSRKRSADKVIG